MTAQTQNTPFFASCKVENHHKITAPFETVIPFGDHDNLEAHVEKLRNVSGQESFLSTSCEQQGILRAKITTVRNETQRNDGIFRPEGATHNSPGQSERRPVRARQIALGLFVIHGLLQNAKID